MRPHKLRTRPNTEAPGHCPWMSTVLVVGLFREGEEGINIASDVVNVKGQDSVTPGSLRGDRAR